MILLGDQIRMARERSGLTTLQLAFHVGVSEQSIKNYEKHIRIPKRQFLTDIEKILGVRLSVSGNAAVIDQAIHLDQEVIDIAMLVSKLPEEERRAFLCLLKNGNWNAKLNQSQP
jgi:transcriptional regulator with XRE-family HTH domain